MPVLRKVGNNPHYTICNSQVPSTSRFRVEPANYCNCAELLQVEIDNLKQQQTAAYKFGAVQSNIPAGSYGYVNPNIGYSSSAHYPSMGTTAAFRTNSVAQAMYDRLEFPEDEIRKPYIKALSYYDIIADTLQALQDHSGFYPGAYSNINTYSIFHENYSYRCNEAEKNNPQLLKMSKPEMKLVMIGMDVDLKHLSSTSFVIKPLKGFSYNGHILRKGTFWVLNEPVKDTPPFYLFEFPTNQGLQPKSDYVLLIDPYIPEEDFLTDCVYHKFGIKIMRKFDIKDAHKLLNTRKSVFNSAPTATNTILLFQLMDAIVLNDFKTGTLDLDKTGEKNLIRLEKLKNLALDTKFNEERKNAVDKALMQFDIICSKKEEKVG